MTSGRGAALLGAAGLLLGCAGGAPPAGAPAPSADAPSTTAPEPAPIEAGRAPPPGPYRPGFDVLHYRIELTLPDTGRRIAGRTTLTVRRVEADADPLVLDLTGLAVDSVRTAPARGERWTTVPADDYRAALERGELPVPVGPGPADDTLRVRVFYRGTPDDGLILRPTVHGHPAAFADNWPNRARFWFPSVDHPSDKATVSFSVHAPEDRQVVANGTLVGPPTGASEEIPRTEDGPPPENLRTWRWATDVPIPTYTMVVGAAEFSRTRVGLAACGDAPAAPRRDGCVEVTTWLFPGSAETGAPSFARAGRMVDYFTRAIGAYPYEKLANVQSATRFGGMENASAIFYSERPLASGENIEGTVSHEIAHQWFGDSVTEADWHHLWLSEGFATYFGALFFEHADGVEEFRRRMERNRRRYLGSDVVDRPVVDPDEDDLFELLNANNYPKGAWVLHMLRGVVGDDAFFRGVRRYYRAHRNGTALTRDFRAAMEEASGRKLGWFFRQWIFEPGYPRLDVSWSHEAGADTLRVRVEQVQPGTWPTFRLPARILVTRSDGTQVSRSLELRERSETVSLAVAGEPTSVVFDPDGWILAEVRTERREP